MARPEEPGEHRSARDELASRVVAVALARGIGEISQRDLAAAIGTSHRMLNYHFGGRAGVVRVVVDYVEAAQRNLFSALARESTSPHELGLQHWATLADPSTRPQILLFVEVLSAALRGEPGTEGFLERVTTEWLTAIRSTIGSGRRAGIEADATEISDAEAEALLSIATVRGLLFEAAIASDATLATRAFALFLERVQPRSRRRGSGTSATRNAPGASLGTAGARGATGATRR